MANMGLIYRRLTLPALPSLFMVIGNKIRLVVEGVIAYQLRTGIEERIAVSGVRFEKLPESRLDHLIQSEDMMPRQQCSTDCRKCCVHAI